ncbi:MAG: hypothetical protein JWQ27_1590 [Ferruginibacter sp.]|nr:hypothetical protein [Ferruginibacter sp.]
MSHKNSKQFGVWMDTQHAIVVGKENESGTFSVLGHVSNENVNGNSSEKNANNAEQSAQLKFFKEIAALMTNAEEVHVTGTGTSQEQFIHFLADTPQYKNVIAKETTANKMSDEKLLEFISEKFN